MSRIALYLMHQTEHHFDPFITTHFFHSFTFFLLNSAKKVQCNGCRSEKILFKRDRRVSRHG